MSSAAAPGRGSRAALAAAAVVLVLAVVAGYLHRTLFDADQFAARATATLRDERVRTVVARDVTDGVVLAQRDDLLAARPLIASVVGGIVGAPPFAKVFELAVRDLHRAVIGHDQDTVTLTVADVGTLLHEGLRTVRPKLADQVAERAHVRVATADLGAVGGRLTRVAVTTKWLALGLAALGIALAGAGIALDPDRRRAVHRLAVWSAGAAVVLIGLLALVHAVVRGRFTGDDRGAVDGVWHAFLGGLVWTAWALALASAVVAAAARSAVRTVDLGALLRRAGAVVADEPEATWARWLRALALIAAGVAVVAAPAVAVRLVVTVAGLVLAYAGVNAVLRLVERPGYRLGPADDGLPGRPSRALLRRGAATGVTAGLVAGIAAGLLGSGEVSQALPHTGACNGHRALCDRTLPQVTLAATHNAMSVPGQGWYSAEQDGSIRQQLDAGVRGLLIDTHYADRLDNGRLRTDLSNGGKLEDTVGPSGVAAAERLRARAGFQGGGERGLYLCHTFCELGGTPLDAALADIDRFMVSHPEEVVVLVNQDEISPQDFVGAMRKAGLDRLALVPPGAGERWPTLRQMIDRDQRLVVLAENHAGGAPWYRLAYDGLVQETPYTFPRAKDLTQSSELPASCAPNRGGTRAPLFLMNHWVSTDPAPRPSDARIVNAEDVLVRRAEVCRRLRHHLPNLVAVNFYAQGQLEAAVDALNGVTGPR